MTEWKMSELDSVKTLTESDLEKTVGGNGNTLTTATFDWFNFFKGKTRNHM